MLHNIASSWLFRIVYVGHFVFNHGRYLWVTNIILAAINDLYASPIWTLAFTCVLEDLEVSGSNHVLGDGLWAWSTLTKMGWVEVIGHCSWNRLMQRNETMMKFNQYIFVSCCKYDIASNDLHDLMMGSSMYMWKSTVWDCCCIPHANKRVYSFPMLLKIE